MNHQVRTAAAADLNCHQSAIEFVDDRPLEKHVRGCGQELIYSRVCGGSGPRGLHGTGDTNYTGTCQWVARLPEESDDELAAPEVEQSFEAETTVEAEQVNE